jgi:uncharacterized membrane protein
MNALIAGMLLSLAPVSELRGGIPFAIAKGINPWSALVFCVIANILVIPLVFLFLDFLHKRLLHARCYERTFNVFLKRIRKRRDNVEKNIESYGMLALAVFVAIPLPMTGAWAGTLIAWLLGLHKGKSFLAIAAGVIMAGIIITLATLGIIKAFF